MSQNDILSLCHPKFLVFRFSHALQLVENPAHTFQAPTGSNLSVKLSDRFWQEK